MGVLAYIEFTLTYFILYPLALIHPKPTLSLYLSQYFDYFPEVNSVFTSLNALGCSC